MPNLPTPNPTRTVNDPLKPPQDLSEHQRATGHPGGSSNGIVDHGTVPSDPTPLPSDNRFHVWERSDTGEVWGAVNGDVNLLWPGQIYTVVKAANETVNNSAVLQNDDELLFAIAANTTWVFEFFLFVASVTTTPDIKFGFSAPSGCTVEYQVTGPAAAGAVTDIDSPHRVTPTNTSAAGVGVFASSGAGAPITIKGIATNGANAGTVNLQWAQNTATAENTIVYAHSFLIALKSGLSPSGGTGGGGGSSSPLTTKGDIWGFSTLDARIPVGADGTFLKADSAQALGVTWGTVTLTNALLDGANHTDTVAQTVSRGSLIYGNSTPKWDELVVGAANRVLWTDGTDVSWSAAPRLADIANTAGTNVITTVTTGALPVTMPALILNSTYGGAANFLLAASSVLTASVSGTFGGVNTGLTLTATTNNTIAVGVTGTAGIASFSGGTGLKAQGLSFTALGTNGNFAATFSELGGLTVLGKAIAVGASSVATVTLMYGGDFTIATQIAASGTVNVTAGYGVRVNTPTRTTGGTITTVYGVYVNAQNFTGSTTGYGVYVEDVTVGTNRWPLWVGDATGKLAVKGSTWTPAAGETPIWVLHNATFRQVKTIDPGAGGANFVGGELVCILV